MLQCRVFLSGTVLRKKAGVWKPRSVEFTESQLADFTVKLMNKHRISHNSNDCSTRGFALPTRGPLQAER